MTASDYCEQGRQMMNAGKLVVAMEYFQAAIEMDKHFEEAYMLLADVYKKQGKPEKAKATLYALLAIDTTNSSAEKGLKDLLSEPSDSKQNSNETDSTIQPSTIIQSLAKNKVNYTAAYKGVVFDMVFVEGGGFLYGAQNNNVYQPNYDEKATFRESVCNKSVGDFYIGKFLVTQKQWMEVMGINPASHHLGGNYPIENVTSTEVFTFLRRLSEETGCKFRLPTDVEWEYAARGGKQSKGYKYPGSDVKSEVCWTIFDSTYTKEVGQKKPNELGLYDMLGNVCEFCKGDTFLSRSSGLMGPGLVLRGGVDKRVWDWYAYEKSRSRQLERINLCRISAWTKAPLNADENIGFRLAMDV